MRDTAPRTGDRAPMTGFMRMTRESLKTYSVILLRMAASRGP